MISTGVASKREDRSRGLFVTGGNPRKSLSHTHTPQESRAKTQSLLPHPTPLPQLPQAKMLRRPAAAAAPFAPLILLPLLLSSPFWFSASPAATAVGGQFILRLLHSPLLAAHPRLVFTATARDPSMVELEAVPCCSGIQKAMISVGSRDQCVIRPIALRDLSSRRRRRRRFDPSPKINSFQASLGPSHTRHGRIKLAPLHPHILACTGERAAAWFNALGMELFGGIYHLSSSSTIFRSLTFIHQDLY
jgi:hypothetical protein